MVAAPTKITQTGNGTFDDVTVGAGSTVQLHGNLTVTNGLTMDGMLFIGDVGGPLAASLTVAGTQTIGGNGSIVFGSVGGNLITTTGGEQTITFGPALTIRGQNGTMRSGAVTHYVVQGTIQADNQ